MSGNNNKMTGGSNSGGGAEGGNSSGKVRYFVIKASTYKQLEASHHMSLWAFTHSTEKKILQATQVSKKFPNFCWGTTT